MEVTDVRTGTGTRRDLLLVAVSLPAAALLWAVPAGAFTTHRVDVVAAAYPLLVAGTWTVVGWPLLRSHPGTLRVCLVVLAVLGALGGALVLSPAPVVAARADPSGVWVASAEEIGLGLDTRVTVTRPGLLVSAELGSVCTTDTSGVLNDANLTWTSRRTFTLTVGEEPRPYATFRVVGDRVQPDDSDFGWRPC